MKTMKSMRIMKALIILVVMVCLVFSMAACSSNNKTPDSTAAPEKAAPAEKTEPTAEAAVEPVKEDVTIKFTRWASGEEEKDFRAWLDEFEATHPNIKVESEFLPYGPFFQKMKTDLIAGTAADVISFTFGEWFAYTQSDVYVDLNTFPDAKDVFGQLIEGTVQGFNVDGKQLGAPIGVGRRIPFINKDLFAQANVALPSQTDPMTISQWVDMLKKLQAGLGKDFMAANLFPIEIVATLAMSAGSPLVTADGKKIMVNTPEGIKAVQGFADLMTSGAQVPPAQVWEGAWGNPDSAVSTGKVAVGWTGVWSFPAMKEANVKFMSIPAPIAEGGQTVQPGYLNGQAIPASSKNKEAAWELLKWMLSKEGQMSFGKFSDSPVHKEAAIETQNNLSTQDLDSFGGYAAASNGITPYPAYSGDYGALQDKLISDLAGKKITAEQFAQQLEKDGQPLLDKYQANIGK